MTAEIDGKKINHVATKQGDQYVFNNEELFEAMQNAKITIYLPKNRTHPELAGDVETLTQRYWEAMLSRMVIVGHAPKELVNLIGYNPVIELTFNSSISLTKQVAEILENIEQYQDIVNRNRDIALKSGDWKKTITFLKSKLVSIGYKI